jgi:hypothetical protein
VAALASELDPADPIVPAEGETTVPPITPGQSVDVKTITIHKSIIVNGAEEAEEAEEGEEGEAAAADPTKPLAPKQTITFTVGEGKAEKANKDAVIPVITISEAVFAEGATAADITITMDKAFNSTGIYTYEVTENDNKAAGVNGNKAIDKMELKITVVQGKEGLELGGIALRQKGKKTDTIENTYEAGALTVQKLVTGNLGETDKDFEVTVTFTAPEGRTVLSTIAYVSDAAAAADKEDKTIAPADWKEGVATAVIKLKADEKVTFTNIPADVTYTVVESDYVTTDNYDKPVYVKDSGKIAAKTTEDATITNNKEIIIDTGVTVETLPYVMILAIAMIGAVVMLRKREEY